MIKKQTNQVIMIFELIIKQFKGYQLFFDYGNLFSKVLTDKLNTVTGKGTG